MFTKSQFVSFFVWAILCSAAFVNAENLIVNPGFETSESTSGGLPTTYGDWKGDYSAISGSTLGITPFSGSKMLQFLGTGYTSSGGTATTCDINQLINISSYQNLIASGNAKAVASGYFNRVAGDSQTDTKFGLIILAYNGSPNSFPSLTPLISDYNVVYADNLLATWERVEITLDLPANTTFIDIVVNIHENIYNDSSYPEFDGHFADNISLTIIPEPTMIILFGTGVLGLCRRR